jgi:copper chaperone NosL
MRKHLAPVLILLGMLLAGCSPAPREIQFGIDLCHSCMMTIVDNRHAAQVVTAKGRNYPYDAIECMLRDIRNTQDQDHAFVLVSNYGMPGQMIDAYTATYLVSQAIPSPMGAFLSAFDTRENAHAVQQEKGGEIYDWSGIQKIID